MEIPTLKECFERFVVFGECGHYHLEKVRPYGCKVEIKTCKVCKKEMGRVYL